MNDVELPPQGESEEESRPLISDLVFLRKLSTMKVLIVDDQKNMVKTIENMLVGVCLFKKKSESIFRADDGGDALEILNGQPPRLPHKIDLVLLDWNMPTMPGIEVIKAIRTSKFGFVRDVPVIMITGEANIGDVNEAIFSGVDNYLLKPFLTDDLRKRMNPLIRRHWSMIKIARKKSRRSVERYPAGSAVKMTVELEFANGERKNAEVLDISPLGVRVECHNPLALEVRSLRFPSYGRGKESVNRCDCIVVQREESKDAPENHISIRLINWPEDGVAENLWLEWLATAKGKYLSYRGQHF
ncbi:MAG: response regulator [Nitrospinae bacterium]|nr:response regulator [Nitrospinota bacterium]